MTAELTPAPKIQFLDDNGDPLSGGKVYFYEIDTVTPKDTYTDQAASVPNTNPVILDSRGEATIRLSGSYDVVVKDSAGSTIYTIPDVGSGTDAIHVVPYAAGGGVNVCHRPTENSIASNLHTCGILSGGTSGTSDNNIGAGGNTAAHYSVIPGGYDNEIAPNAGDNCIASYLWSMHGEISGASTNHACALGGSYPLITGGDYPATIGGLSNAMSGACHYAFNGGGQENAYSGSHSGGVGGYSNAVTGQYSFQAAVYDGTLSGSYSFLSGRSSQGTADYSYTMGRECVNAQNYSLTWGFGATSRYKGHNAFASGYLTTAGDTQAGKVHGYADTANATPTELRPGETSNMVLPNTTVWAFRAVVACRTNGGSCGGWIVEGMVKRDASAATTAIVGTPTITNLGLSGLTTATVTVGVSTSTGKVYIAGTGEAATNLLWSVHFMFSEVTY